MSTLPHQYLNTIKLQPCKNGSSFKSDNLELEYDSFSYIPGSTKPLYIKNNDKYLHNLIYQIQDDYYDRDARIGVPYIVFKEFDYLDGTRLDRLINTFIDYDIVNPRFMSPILNPNRLIPLDGFTYDNTFTVLLKPSGDLYLFKPFHNLELNTTQSAVFNKLYSILTSK